MPRLAPVLHPRSADVRGPFVIDVLGSFPLSIVIQIANPDGADDQSTSAGRVNRQLRMLRILKLNRLLRLSRLAKKLKYLELAIRFNPSSMRLFKLAAMMALVSHWIGCVWWFVADAELAETSDPWTPQNSWQPSEELLRSPTLGPQFAAAFLWGAGMVTAMLPFDIEPATEVERYLTVICIFLGLVLNAFVIGSMASALSTMDSKKAVAAGKLSTISAYLQLNNVAPELRSHILEYYEYLYTSSESMADLRLYQDLPAALSMRLSLSVHRRILARCPALYALSDGTLLSVLGKLSPQVCVPGQVIIAEGTLQRSVFFLNKGRMLLIRGMGTPAEAIVRVVGQYDNFGCKLCDEDDESNHPSSPPKFRQEGNQPINLRDKHAPKMLLQRQFATESARAEMYCDLSCLDLTDLANMISKERSWGKLQESNYITAPKGRKGCMSGLNATGFARRISRISEASRSKSPRRPTSKKPAEPSNGVRKTSGGEAAGCGRTNAAVYKNLPAPIVRVQQVQEADQHGRTSPSGAETSQAQARRSSQESSLAAQRRFLQMAEEESDGGGEDEEEETTITSQSSPVAPMGAQSWV